MQDENKETAPVDTENKIDLDSIPPDWEALAKALLAERKVAGLDPRTGVKVSDWVLAKRAKNRAKAKVARAARKVNRGSNRGR
jgi:hypothetical protein